MSKKLDGTRKSIKVPEEVWEAIIDIQHEERMASQAEAVRRILIAGISAIRQNRNENGQRSSS